MVDCLLDWGRAVLARDYLTYYFDTLVEESGRIDYYFVSTPVVEGSSVSEYGQLLWLVRKCMEAGGNSAWFEHLRPKVEAIRARLWAAQAGSPSGLIVGAPEADLRDWQHHWFHNNGWAWRGLNEVAPLLGHDGEAARLRLFRETLQASIRQHAVTSAAPSFISPKASAVTPFPIMSDGDLPSYTNIRFWPELLSCGLLTPQQMNDIVAYRLGHNGEIAGLGRMRRTGVSGASWADNWMVAEYAAGLRALGQTNEVLRLLYSYLSGNVTRETATAYEMVTTYTNGTGNTHFTDYCATAQLVPPRLTAWLYGNTVRFAAADIAAPSHYWDVNGPAAGAGGGSPSGAWDGTASHWNTDATGAGGGECVAATDSGDDLVFCASDDATGAYTVTLSGTQHVGSLTFENGSATLPGGVLRLAPTAFVVAPSGRTAVIASDIQCSETVLAKFGLGTLLLTSTSAAGVLWC